MALTKCKECNREISNTATNCPHCGAKVQNTEFEKILWGFGILGIIYFIATYIIKFISLSH